MKNRPNFEKINIVDSALHVQHHRFTLGGRRHIWTCILWAPDLETNQPTIVGRGVALLNPVDLPNNDGKISERIGRSMAYGRALRDLYDNRGRMAANGINITDIRWFPEKDKPQVLMEPGLGSRYQAG